MSTAAYNRAIARETNIWKPFIYSFPFLPEQIEDRDIMYSLYSSSYLNQNTYLLEIETQDLSNLLNDYNTKLAEISNEQQIVIMDIVSKRYLAQVDKNIHDQKMITKQEQIAAENTMWDAKFAALAADRAALDTLNTQVATAIIKTNAKITELTTYIEIEGINLSQVDIEIAEKEISSSKVDIEILNAANEVLRLQLSTIEAAIKLVDVDLQIAGTKKDIAGVELQREKIGLLPIDLTVAQAQTAIANAQLPIAAGRVALSMAKSTEVDKELTFTGTTLMQEEATNLLNQESLLSQRQIIRENELLKNLEQRQTEFNNRVAASQLEPTFATADQTNKAAIDAQSISTKELEYALFVNKVNAALEVAETLSKAKIASTLIHTIGLAPTT